MNITFMIYIYIIICTALIFFEIFWVLKLRFDDSYQKHIASKIYRKLKSECTKIQQEDNFHISKKTRNYFFRVLSAPYYATAFMTAYSDIKNEYKSELMKFTQEICTVILPVCKKINKSGNSIAKAYIAKIIAEIANFGTNGTPRALISILFEFLLDKSVFCRANAMTAVYALGTAPDVIHAIQILTENNLFYHPKILAEGLCTFSGNHDYLSLLLLKDFDNFTEEYKISILDYYRRKSDNIGEFLIDILTENSSVDVKCAVLRYFKYHPNEEACKVIMGILENDSDYSWEIPAVAAKALDAYDNADVRKLLKNALTNSNWYIRRNAAESLVNLGLEVNEIAEIIENNDRYAREILQYNLTIKDIRNARTEKELNI